MLRNPVFRLQARFAKELSELILTWAYNWLRGKGGYFVEREGVREQIPPAMRLVEVADFSLEFIARLGELRENKDIYPFSLARRIRAINPTAKQSREAGDRRQGDTRAVLAGVNTNVPKGT